MKPCLSQSRAFDLCNLFAKGFRGLAGALLYRKRDGGKPASAGQSLTTHKHITHMKKLTLLALILITALASPALAKGHKHAPKAPKPDTATDCGGF